LEKNVDGEKDGSEEKFVRGRALNHPGEM
jgi:hypothetical protein